MVERDTERVEKIDGVSLNLLLDDTRDVIDKKDVTDAHVDDKGVGVEITEIDFRTLVVTDALT